MKNGNAAGKYDDFLTGFVTGDASHSVWHMTHVGK